jgi:pyruvate,water dikinase
MQKALSTPCFLEREGIDSISINPDSIMKITMKVLETEEKDR